MPLSPNPQKQDVCDGPLQVRLWYRLGKETVMMNFWMDLVNNWGREESVERFLAGMRRCLDEAWEIIAIKLPWEQERRVFDPPLGPLPGPATAWGEL